MQPYYLLRHSLNIRHTLLLTVHIDMFNNHNMVEGFDVLNVGDDGLHALGNEGLAE